MYFCSKWRGFVKGGRIIIMAAGILVLILAFTASPGCKNKAGEQKTPQSPMEVPQPPNPSLATPVKHQPAPEGPPNPSGNLLVNPGFEKGREGWFWLDWSEHWVDFDISSERAHTGKKSAYLKLDAKVGAPEVRIHGVVQTLTPSRFPDVARGFYRVENWNRGSAKQYMQFVVIVWGGHERFKNYQIRYILAGVRKQPFSINNGKYIIGKDVPIEPVQNEWVPFSFPIRDDFMRLWGRAPTGYEKINFFFEARYDQEPAKGERVRADVYFDDLYVGDGQTSP